MKKDKEYEQFVRDIYETLLKATGFDEVKVQHDVKMISKYGQKHQVDVYWEYKILGIINKVSIECKYYNSKVKIEHLRAVKGLLADFPEMRAVVVTKVGFQKGAIKYAKQHGIGLRLIRPAIDIDFEGRTRTIHLQAHLKSVDFVGLSLEIDENWISTHFSEGEKIKLGNAITISGSGKSISVYDRELGLKKSVDDLLNSIPVLQIEPLDFKEINSGKVYSQKFEWNSAYLISPDNPDLPIKSLVLEYKIITNVQEITVGGKEVAYTLVKDAVEGHSLFIDDDGAISGDTEEAL